MGGHDGILSMNHLGSMKINDSVDLLFLSFLVAPLFPINVIPCHLHLLCIHTLSCVDEGFGSPHLLMHLWAHHVGCSQHPKI